MSAIGKGNMGSSMYVIIRQRHGILIFDNITIEP